MTPKELIDRLKQSHSPKRAVFIVSVNLDPVPGAFNKSEDWDRFLKNTLDSQVKHYHPKVEFVLEVEPSPALRPAPPQEPGSHYMDDEIRSVEAAHEPKPPLATVGAVALHCPICGAFLQVLDWFLICHKCGLEWERKRT